MPDRHRSARSLSAAPPLLDALEPRLLLTSLTPAVVRHAYAFDQLSYGTLPADGRGQTIAIVAAYDDPTIAADLDTFDKTFGITAGINLYAQHGAASAVLSKHEMTTNLAADASWSQEISLDVEWAHAIAPGAHILLVEAASDSVTDLLAAVNYARSQPTVSVVSMSWGSSEYTSEWNDDNTFLTPTGHQGVTFVAAAGDQPGTTWPAISPYVLAVGGTTLLTSGQNYLGEAAWSGTGGGTSLLETAPAFEQALTGSAFRTNPDVAYDADPATGFYVYDSTAFQGQSGWLTFGGTSAGTPQWAALVAIANEGRTLVGKATLDGPTQTLPALSVLPGADFHDITLGVSADGFTSASPGYDALTGRGSPVANRVIFGLLAWNSTTATVVHTPLQNNFNRHRFPFFEIPAAREAHLLQVVQPFAALSASQLPAFYKISLLPTPAEHHALALL
jgi:subtilase family serine protease